MSEMVERVAAGIYERFEYDEGPPEEKPVWVKNGNSLKQTAARIFARAAIKAMRTATRPMTIAAEKMGAGEAWAEDCWAAMIDAALEEPE